MMFPYHMSCVLCILIVWSYLSIRYCFEKSYKRSRDIGSSVFYILISSINDAQRYVDLNRYPWPRVPDPLFRHQGEGQMG